MEKTEVELFFSVFCTRREKNNEREVNLLFASFALKKSKNVNAFIVFQDNLSNLCHEKVTKIPKHDFEAFFVLV